MLIYLSSRWTLYMDSGGTYPVHSSINVESSKDIYETDDWWKAAVRYSTKQNEEWIIAIYLWHDGSDGWTRKNKYNIKSTEAWQMDVELIESYLSTHPHDMGSPPELPVSDYYSLAAGETILKTEDWWKAIVVIDQKGNWETFEVIIYLWQKSEGKWRRRQKYAIKDEADWLDDRDAVNALLRDVSSQSIPTRRTKVDRDTPEDIDLKDSPVVQIAHELGIDSSGTDELTEQIAGLHLVDN